MDIIFVLGIALLKCNPTHFFQALAHKNTSPGPPGAGKGTHCKRLQSQSTEICHISVGDFLREIQQNGLPAGQESIAEALRTGVPMPGGVLADLLSQRLVEEEKHGATVALIDGFPRSVDQAEEFKVTVGAL